MDFFCRLAVRVSGYRSKSTIFFRNSNLPQPLPPLIPLLKAFQKRKGNQYFHATCKLNLAKTQARDPMNLRGRKKTLWRNQPLRSGSWRMSTPKIHNNGPKSSCLRSPKRRICLLVRCINGIGKREWLYFWNKTKERALLLKIYSPVSNRINLTLMVTFHYLKLKK